MLNISPEAGIMAEQRELVGGQSRVHKFLSRNGYETHYALSPYMTMDAPLLGDYHYPGRDKKKTYGGLLRRAFGEARLRHMQIDSKRKRDPRNPLHRINLTLATARDLMGRLRRRSWLVTKKAEFLNLHLAMLACYRNYHRPRFNKDSESPAMLLGFLPRRLSKQELLSWRQDWGPGQSIHPLSPWEESVED